MAADDHDRDQNPFSVLEVLHCDVSPAGLPASTPAPAAVSTRRQWPETPRAGRRGLAALDVLDLDPQVTAAATCSARRSCIDDRAVSTRPGVSSHTRDAPTARQPTGGRSQAVASSSWRAPSRSAAH
ncbi:MAG: hypothetical protein RLW62_06915 [Gammaproteobacteria bacterium]